jgi:glucosylglycerol-phosphate synthase
LILESRPVPTRTSHAQTTDSHVLLATDLDGTFLGGNADQRATLYRTVSRHPDIRLAYVTGRGLEAVLPLLGDPTVPSPEFIICDVGATVVDGRTLRPIEPLQGSIDARWPGERKVASALSGIEGLVRQDVPQERRCSYYCDPQTLLSMRPLLDAIAADLGCEVLYSADRYLDFLPPGTNKGSTLTALVALLGIERARVLVAGDTLNDLSMYGHGFRGVCVGESEQALLDSTVDLDNVLHADEPGCGGILQAFEHHQLVSATGMLEHAEPDAHDGKAELVMLYHRLPYEEVVENGERIRRRPRSPNGIIPTLLSFFANDRAGSWIAWTQQEGKRAPAELHVTVDAELYPKLNAALVPLSKQDVEIFYKRFSKEAFWPLLHTFWERARFREEDWKVFLKVNRLFAERAAAEAAPGATVWIHDYNLWMVPATLRELRPDLKIAFFHHTYFPSADVFNVVPWRREIIGSLLACDYIGFHIPRQVENFVDVVRGAMPVETISREGCAPRFLTYGCAVGLDRMTTCIETGGRRVRLGAHPVGLDVDRVKKILVQPETRARIDALRHDLAGQRLLLAVERLDYTKGTLERLQAFERLLEQEPDLHGQCTLVNICVPADKDMTVYRQLQSQIEQVVGRINGRFSRVGWTPVQYFFRPLPFEEVVAYYAVTDLAWITPLRDGLNLVAKEFVAVQGITRGYGKLVLSEFAGSAAELKGALLTNPHDPADLVSTCLQGLTMSRNEARSRLRQMFEIVRHYDVKRWGDEFLEAVGAGAAKQQG